MPTIGSRPAILAPLIATILLSFCYETAQASVSFTGGLILSRSPSTGVTEYTISASPWTSCTTPETGGCIYFPYIVTLPADQACTTSPTVWIGPVVDVAYQRSFNGSWPETASLVEQRKHACLYASADYDRLISDREYTVPRIPAVPSTITLRAAAARGRCLIDTEVEVLPDLDMLAQPFANVEVTVRGVGGKAVGYSKTRRLPLGTAVGYRFANLKRGRYRVVARYPGDPFRLASNAQQRTLSVRC